jgi:hypothetical protein
MQNAGLSARRFLVLQLSTREGAKPNYLKRLVCQGRSWVVPPHGLVVTAYLLPRAPRAPPPTGVIRTLAVPD